MRSVISDAKTLTLNVTIASADCAPKSESVCNFMDPKYWIPSLAPADGDSVVINASVNMTLSVPLKLASLQISKSSDSFITTISTTSNLTIGMLNSAGSLLLNGGYIYFDTDFGISHQLQISLSGNVTLSDFTADRLFLDKGSFLARNIVAGQFFMGTDASLLFETITANQILANKIIGKSINITGVDTHYGSYYAIFMGDTKVESILLQGTLREVSVYGNMEVNSLTITGFVQYLTIQWAELISTGPLRFGSAVEHVHLLNRTTIIAPTVEFFQNRIKVVDARINGSTIFGYGGSLDLQTDFYLAGNVDMLDPEIRLNLYYNNETGAMVHPKIIIDGQMLQYGLSLRLLINGFMAAPTEFSEFISFKPSNTSLYLHSDDNVKFQKTDTSIAFASTQTTFHGPLTPLNIGLMVGCGASVVIIIALIVVLSKKRTGYKLIQ